MNIYVDLKSIYFVYFDLLFSILYKKSPFNQILILRIRSVRYLSQTGWIVPLKGTVKAQVSI